MRPIIPLGSPRTLRRSVRAAALLAVAACAGQGGEGAASESDGDAVRTTDSAVTDATVAGQPPPSCWTRAEPAELAERASPLDSTSVRLEAGVVKICHGSPQMRGREIMGGLVPWNEPWRTGANEATSIHMPAAGTIAGVSVEPGRYSLYSIPGPETWEIVVNGEPERWGIPISQEVRAADVGSGSVPVGSMDEPVEGLTLTLSREGRRAASLAIEWETTRVEVPIRLD